MSPQPGRRYDVHVWALSLAESDETDRALLSSVCDPAELEHSLRFVFDRDRRAYLAAHGLLRLALSAYDPARDPLEWSFRRGQYGRPEIAEDLRSPLRFSLSHCVTRVVCVACRKLNCGIDIEPTSRVVDSAPLMRQVLSQREREWVSSVPPELRTERFLRLWTLKEAISKAVGLGLALPFEQIDLDVSGAPTLRDAPPAAAPPWFLAQRRSTGSHIEALALRIPLGDAVEVFYHEWTRNGA